MEPEIMDCIAINGNLWNINDGKYVWLRFLKILRTEWFIGIFYCNKVRVESSKVNNATISSISRWDDLCFATIELIGKTVKRLVLILNFVGMIKMNYLSWKCICVSVTCFYVCLSACLFVCVGATLILFLTVFFHISFY